MKNVIKIVIGAVALGALAGCVETSSNSNDGLSGTDAQFNAMTAPCIDQAQE